MNPTEIDLCLSSADVDAHRRIHCRRYDNCVLYATDKGWRSFSCCQCQVRDELTREELREQAHKIAVTFRRYGDGR